MKGRIFTSGSAPTSLDLIRTKPRPRPSCSAIAPRVIALIDLSQAGISHDFQRQSLPRQSENGGSLVQAPSSSKFQTYRGR